METLIIHIDGVQGSGKSYICSKLKNVLCVDADDIMEQTKKNVSKILGSEFPAKINKRTIKLIQREENKIVRDYVKNSDIVVFAGMVVDMPDPTYKFFIKIDDFETVYKRLLLRELEKIVLNHKKIETYIKNTNPKEMNIFNVSHQSIPFPSTYVSFLQDYKERLQDAKKQKYMPKTQNEIINFINSL